MLTDRDFTPRLENSDLPDLSGYSTLHARDFQRAGEVWDRLMPSEYKDLLFASFVGERVTAFPVIARGDWRFLLNVQRYRNSKTGAVVNQIKNVELRDDFTDALHPDAERLGTELSEREITLHAWCREMARVIQTAHVGLWLLGAGGYNAIDTSAVVTLEGTLRQQLDLLTSYAERIKTQNRSDTERQFRLTQRLITARGVINRGIMFIEAATQSGERGRITTYGFHSDILPHYPGDGSTECMWRCRCHWRLVYPKGQNSYYHAYWRLRGGHPDGRNCATCLVYAERYNPYTVIRF